ncbi:MAG: hypothetical protein ACR2LC_05765 [Pyrinomonadaceae bacterium]
MKKYPDIKEIIKNKAAHRRSLAALSFEEKIEIVFSLQKRKRLIKSGQAVNQQKPKALR